MENFEAQFCRLCLNSINDINYKLIDGVIRENLDVLLKLDFDNAHKQVICNSCLQKLDAAFKFKSTCLHTSDVIVSHTDLESLDPVDLKEIYLKESGTGELSDEEICRLCMQPVKKQFVSIHEVDASIFQKYVPEVNFGATMNPVICKSCVDALTAHSSFIKDCLGVEEKVKHFFNSETRNSPVKDSHLDLCIKSEEIKEEICNEIIFKSELNIDTINETDNETETVKIEQTVIKMESTDEESLQSSQDIKQAPTMFEFVDESSLNLTTPEFNIHMEIPKNPEGQSYSCDVCDYFSKTKSELTTHMKIHKDPREIQWYECDMCNVKFKLKKSLKNHMLIHKNDKIKWYKCHICFYRSKVKEHLNEHMLIHKNASEVQQYACDICDFKSKHKTALHTHMAVHRDGLELQWYACETCDRKFKYKYNLNKHNLKHMPVQSDASEIKYECEVCHCMFKNKQNLHKHMVIHKDASEIQWFECDICGYKAKRKSNLNGHMLTHKDASEIQWYQCDVCDYKSKQRGGLKGHMMIHKDASEIQWFECQVCDYKSKYKNHLNKHIQTHRGASKIQ